MKQEFQHTGKLQLGFRKKQSGKTYLAKQYYELPLQILPPYYPDQDGTAFVYLLNPTGGVLQGDRLLTEVAVEKGASAVVTTPAANKLYKMESDYAEIVNTFNVDDEGVLEFIPDYNIPYAKSNVYQSNTFHLHKNAKLIAWDMVIPGRTDRGEYFDYELYDSKNKIYVDGSLEAYEYSKLSPLENNMKGIGVLEGYDIYSSIFIYHKDLSTELKEKISNTWKDTDSVKGGVSQISDSMICIKILGNSVFETWEVMLKIWGAFRKTILNKEQVKIRKY